jgi:hypothetical protein
VCETQFCGPVGLLEGVDEPGGVQGLQGPADSVAVPADEGGQLREAGGLVASRDEEVDEAFGGSELGVRGVLQELEDGSDIWYTGFRHVSSPLRPALATQATSLLIGLDWP